MQENVLEKYPDADLRVYAVWLPMLPTDERFDVADLLVDERVTHFWDDDRLTGRLYAELEGWPQERVAWDVVFVYDPQAKWRDKLSEPVGSGGPVVIVTDKLEKTFDAYFG